MKKTLLIALALTALSACSSIVSKSNYPVVISSEPGGASFTITNRAGEKIEHGVTPSTVTLKASSGYFQGESYSVVVDKEGYSTKTYTLSSNIDGWYFGNIMLGGALGMLIVDPATGAMFSLPKRVDISLEDSTSSRKPDTLNIATIDSLTAEQIQMLEPIE